MGRVCFDVYTALILIPEAGLTTWKIEFIWEMRVKNKRIQIDQRSNPLRRPVGDAGGNRAA